MRGWFQQVLTLAGGTGVDDRAMAQGLMMAGAVAGIDHRFEGTLDLLAEARERFARIGSIEGTLPTGYWRAAALGEMGDDRASRSADACAVASTGMNEVRAALENLRNLSEAELSRLCRRHHVRVLTVFGSAIDPSVDEPSDLDIGVVFEPGSSHDVLGLVESFTASLRSERIDLLDATRASETVRYRAIAEGEPIEQSEATAFAHAYAAAVMLYLDTAHLRRDALEHPLP